MNDGQSRYYGAETMGRLQLASRLALEANYSYILGRDLFPNRNIRRLPPMMGFGASSAMRDRAGGRG